MSLNPERLISTVMCGEYYEKEKLETYMSYPRMKFTCQKDLMVIFTIQNKRKHITKKIEHLYVNKLKKQTEKHLSNIILKNLCRT